MSEPSTSLWVVDRVEEPTLVLVEDRTGRTVELDRAAVGAGEAAPLTEGSVLRVPVGPDGQLAWAEAVVDEAARRARMEEAERLLDELKRRDPGGDVRL